MDIRHFANHPVVRLTEHVIAASVAIGTLQVLYYEGPFGVLRVIAQTIRSLPGVHTVFNKFLSREVKNAAKMLLHSGGGESSSASSASSALSRRPAVLLPKQGIPQKTILEEMKLLASRERDVADGKVFAYVYSVDEELKKTTAAIYKMFSERLGLPNTNNHEDFVHLAFEQFIHGNALNPFIFASLRRFENEVVSMSCGLFNGDDECCGTMTSGGTESILMAVKTYRDRARKYCPHIKEPEMVVPITIHPAFEKAAHYFNVKIVHVPVTSDLKVDIKAVEKAVNRNTILIVASAPQYPHAIIDPIEQLGTLAIKKGLPLHVDACFGGFMLPWMEKLGQNIPPWDFRVQGVTSISADMHKYGYCPKGASVILYRNSELRSHQFFAYSSWPGGLFGSPSMAGSRPGGNIAAAWATFKVFGEDGYLKLARDTLETTKIIEQGIRQIPGIAIMGDPQMTAFAFTSNDSTIDILAVADVLETKGWKIERQQLPPSIHFSIYPHHAPIANKLVQEIREATEFVKSNKKLDGEGTAGIYGLVAAIPDQGIVEDFIVQLFGEVFRLRPSQT